MVLAAFCIRCGKRLGEGDKFCTGCGATVDGSFSPQPPPPSLGSGAPQAEEAAARDRSRFMWTWVACLAVIVIGAGVAAGAILLARGGVEQSPLIAAGAANTTDAGQTSATPSTGLNASSTSVISPTETDLSSNASLRASSVHPPDGSNYYYAEYLVDESLETAWSFAGTSGWIEFDFSSPVNVTELHLVAGYQKVVDWDRWPVNNRLRRFSVEYSDGSSETHEVLDERDWQVVKLKGTKTTFVRIVVLGVYPFQTIGTNGWNDTNISEIHVWGSS